MTRIEVGGREAVDLDELAPIYAAAFGEPPYSEPDAGDLLHRLPLHRQRRGFELAVARDTDRAVGFGYAYTGSRGELWTELVAEALGPDRAGALLGGHLELVELAVLPEAHGRGIGTALLEALLTGRPEPRVLLQTFDDDTPAMRLYLRAGFEPLAATTDGDLVLAKELP